MRLEEKLNVSSPVAFFLRCFFALPMHLCYLDESGTPETPGTTSHYILAGISIPIEKWSLCEASINKVKRKFDLLDKEIHTGWILKPYAEQAAVNDFLNLDFNARRIAVTKVREANLLFLQKSATHKSKFKQTRKNYKKTEDYIHLSMDERRELIIDLAKTIGKWGFARLFAECIDKMHYTARRNSVDEQAFEQVVSRLQAFLGATSSPGNKNFGIMIHDNNQTVAKRHTTLMKSFHRQGTLWRRVTNIIETPLFVDSSLTSMVQMADLCSYALRRFCENRELELFELINKRSDTRGSVVVGVRHFTDLRCGCQICSNHKKPFWRSLTHSD